MEVYAFFRNCPQGQILPVVLTVAIRIRWRSPRPPYHPNSKNAARSRICGLCRSLQTILRINLDGTPALVKSRYGADVDKVRPSGQKEKRQASCDACRFFGTPDWIRTSGLQSRSLSLYPAELRAHMEQREAFPLATNLLYHLFRECKEENCTKDKKDC